jgi:hypothetical protein
MYRSSSLFFLIGFISLASCSQQSNKKTENTFFDSKFSLDTFNDIPEGCSCYFSESSESFKRHEYLFTASLEDSVCFVSINNKLTKLRLASTERKSITSEDHSEIYKTDNYTVTVDVKVKNSTGDETWWNDGAITVQSKDGLKIIKKFVGECGC